MTGLLDFHDTFDEEVNLRYFTSHKIFALLMLSCYLMYESSAHCLCFTIFLVLDLIVFIEFILLFYGFRTEI